MQYKGIIVEKKNGKSASAVFYKSAKFQCLHEQQVVFGGEDQWEMPMAHLKDKALGSELVFADVHLKATSAANRFEE